MRSPILRSAALLLASIALGQGLLLAVVHHHPPPGASKSCAAHPPSGGCGEHHPASQESQPAEGPDKQPDRCPICHFLHQQLTLPEFSPEPQEPQALERTCCSSYPRPDLVRPSVYEGRGPPT